LFSRSGSFFNPQDTSLHDDCSLAKKLLTQTLRVAEQIAVDDLLFDAKNFRFLREHVPDQDSILRVLDRDYQLEVIGESLAENGFFPEEPLAAIPDKDKFIVVEGNRRLAALKLLLRPELRHLSKRKEFWDGLSKKMKYDLSKVWVTVHGLTLHMSFWHTLFQTVTDAHKLPLATLQPFPFFFIFNRL